MSSEQAGATSVPDMGHLKRRRARILEVVSVQPVKKFQVNKMACNVNGVMSGNIVSVLK